MKIPFSWARRYALISANITNRCPCTTFAGSPLLCKQIRTRIVTCFAISAMNLASKPIAAAAFVAALLAFASSVLVFVELGRLKRSIAAALPDEATETQQTLPTDAGDLTPPEADFQRAIQPGQSHQASRIFGVSDAAFSSGCLGA